jgi:hypothetical protein
MIFSTTVSSSGVGTSLIDRCPVRADIAHHRWKQLRSRRHHAPGAGAVWMSSPARRRWLPAGRRPGSLGQQAGTGADASSPNQVDQLVQHASRGRNGALPLHRAWMRLCLLRAAAQAGSTGHKTKFHPKGVGLFGSVVAPLVQGFSSSCGVRPPLPLAVHPDRCASSRQPISSCYSATCCAAAVYVDRVIVARRSQKLRRWPLCPPW